VFLAAALIALSALAAPDRPGETADFEISAPDTAPPGYRLEIKTMLAGWYIPINLRVIK
jgi:hypothetical protein